MYFIFLNSSSNSLSIIFKVQITTNPFILIQALFELGMIESRKKFHIIFQILKASLW